MDGVASFNAVCSVWEPPPNNSIKRTPFRRRLFRALGLNREHGSEVKHLRIRTISAHPLAMKAFEYENDIHLSQTRFPELPSVSWESDTLDKNSLVDVLQGRGWHPTDILDALEEAQRHYGPAA